MTKEIEDLKKVINDLKDQITDLKKPSQILQDLLAAEKNSESELDALRKIREDLLALGCNSLGCVETKLGQATAKIKK